MPDLLGLSTRIIDEGAEGAPNLIDRRTLELSEVADGIAVVEAFSHVWSVSTGEGLVVADTSLLPFGRPAVDRLREWAGTDRPVDVIIYTHGHVDHVGGAHAFLADAKTNAHPAPSVVAHRAVPERFDRYDLTNGFNAIINARQFGGTAINQGGIPVFPRNWVRPSRTFDTSMDLDVGGVRFELRHARGETDDHTWIHVPDRKAILCGDLLTWVFPNAGNPQKVQRFPLEWAGALRQMAALRPELLLPAHGLPIGGRDRIARVIDDVATALETLVSQVLDLMNEGACLDRIVQEVYLPPDLADRPYLRPVYDEPEFVIRNTWRRYGGWWDGDPATLKPASAVVVASEVARLAGGPAVLCRRALDVAAAGDLRLATHLVEWAATADPTSVEVHGVRAEIYRARREAEQSLMAKGIYGWAADTSDAVVSGEGNSS